MGNPYATFIDRHRSTWRAQQVSLGDGSDEVVPGTLATIQRDILDLLCLENPESTHERQNVLVIEKGVWNSDFAAITSHVGTLIDSDIPGLLERRTPLREKRDVEFATVSERPSHNLKRLRQSGEVRVVDRVVCQRVIERRSLQIRCHHIANHGGDSLFKPMLGGRDAVTRIP